MPVHRVRPDELEAETLRLEREGEHVVRTSLDEDRNLVFIYTETRTETR